MDQPVVGWLKGYQISISDRLPPILSYGSVCALAGLLSLTALLRKMTWASFIAGAVGIFMTLNVIVMFSITDSKRLVTINDLNIQEKNISSFNKYLPPNLGMEPTFDDTVGVDSALERLYTALHFTTLGWYAAVLGSLLLIIAFVRSGAGVSVRRIFYGVSLPCLLIYYMVVLYPYISAEHHRNGGDAYLASGMFLKAIDEYDITGRLDPNVVFLKRFHINRGMACYSLGKKDVADYYLYRANLYMLEGDFPQAIFYLTQGGIAAPDDPVAAHRRDVSKIYVAYGLSEFKKGNAGPAVNMWKKSLALDPYQYQSYYYLSRAYYNMTSYDEAITAGLQFLKFSKNKIMKANTSANIADAYYRLKNFAMAREYYLKSLNLDTYMNLRANLSLLGK